MDDERKDRLKGEPGGMSDLLGLLGAEEREMTLRYYACTDEFLARGRSKRSLSEQRSQKAKDLDEEDS
jgi:hypothetical protein